MGQQTNGYAESLRRRQFELGQISRDEFEAGTDAPYSSKSIILARRKVRSRYRTDGEKKFREIRLK